MPDPRTFSPVRWDPPLAREIRARRRPVLIAALFGLTVAGAGLALETLIHPTPRLVWNASASAPVGLYGLSPVEPLAAGDIVAAHLPASAARLAAMRHYLPARVPLIKPIGAGPGAWVCARGPTLSIEGRRVAIRLAHDRLGRPLPWWNGCMRLREGQFFLLSPVRDSFDSRYFGPIDARLIVGRARPIWTRRPVGDRP